MISFKYTIFNCRTKYMYEIVNKQAEMRINLHTCTCKSMDKVQYSKLCINGQYGNNVDRKKNSDMNLL